MDIAIKLIEELECTFHCKPTIAENEKILDQQSFQPSIHCAMAHSLQLEIVDTSEMVKTISFPNITFKEFITSLKGSFSALIDGKVASFTLYGNIKGTAIQEKKDLLQFIEYVQKEEFAEKIWISNEIRNKEALNALPWLKNLPKEMQKSPDIEIDLEIVRL